MKREPSEAMPYSTNAHDEQRTVRAVEEHVDVTKRRVETARVRIRKSVRERETTVDLPLTSEAVRIERREVLPPRAVTSRPDVRHEAGTTVIPVIEERAVVTKALFVVEEIVVTRIASERREPMRVALRAEAIDVERVGGPSTGFEAPFQPDQENVMERMLIAVFDTEQQMQTACGALRERGIPGDRVKVRSGVVDEQLKSELVGDNDDANDTGFFSRLFGGLGKARQRSGEYEEAVRRGGSVVIVEGIQEDQIEEAIVVLEQNGAYDIDERAAGWRAGGWKGGEEEEWREHTTAPSAGMGAAQSKQMGTPPTAQPRQMSATASGAAMPNEMSTASDGGSASRQMRATGAAASTQMGGVAQTGRSIPVIEEELRVGKREVQRGGVRVYTRTSERPIEESVTLREEHAHVERRPVNREATEADLSEAFRDQSIEVSETVEEPVVSKTARVVEEVDVGKEVSSRTENVKDTVRRTDVEVENMPTNAPVTRSGRRAT